MSKKLQKPFPAMYPAPLTLVTCVDEQGKPNIITLAYTWARWPQSRPR